MLVLPKSCPWFDTFWKQIVEISYRVLLRFMKLPAHAPSNGLGTLLLHANSRVSHVENMYSLVCVIVVYITVYIYTACIFVYMYNMYIYNIYIYIVEGKYHAFHMALTL